MRRKAAAPSKARLSREIVEPLSGTFATVGPAWTTWFALAGWTTKNAVIAVKVSKSVSEDFIPD